MNNIDYKKVKAWPFQEAIKLKNKVSKIANKKVVTLETGYGPSGDPHIGTFAEVLRTNMVLNCLKEISDFSTNLIDRLYILTSCKVGGLSKKILFHLGRHLKTSRSSFYFAFYR